jgi:hypothetical protein
MRCQYSKKSDTGIFIYPEFGTASRPDLRKRSIQNTGNNASISYVPSAKNRNFWGWVASHNLPAPPTRAVNITQLTAFIRTNSVTILLVVGGTAPRGIAANN